MGTRSTTRRTRRERSTSWAAPSGTNRGPFPTTAKLIESVAVGNHADDTLSSLAGRLARLERTISEDDRKAVQAKSGGRSLRDLANGLLNALDPDRHVEAAKAATGSETPTVEQVGKAAAGLLKAAVAPFDDPGLRGTIVEIHRKNEQTIDVVSKDTVVEAGFSDAGTGRARAIVESFWTLIEDHRDETTALQVLYSRPYRQRKLTHEALRSSRRRSSSRPSAGRRRGCGAPTLNLSAIGCAESARGGS